MCVPRSESHVGEDRLGVLPTAGPVPYLTDSELEARRLLAGAQPTREVVWYHATSVDVTQIAAHLGLVPSCWHGGDCCVVFGAANAHDVKPSRGDALIEICSRAIPGQLRAWWVPRSRIRGAWIGEKFVPTARLRNPSLAFMDDIRPCGCPLSNIVAEQQQMWRRTWQPGSQRACAQGP